MLLPALVSRAAAAPANLLHTRTPTPACSETNHLSTGGIVGAVNNYANLREISNSISLWLGISPPDLFFYAVRVFSVLPFVSVCQFLFFCRMRNLDCAWLCRGGHVIAPVASPSPAAFTVPAAAAGGQCHPHRLLHVLQGGRLCVSIALGSRLLLVELACPTARPVCACGGTHPAASPTCRTAPSPVSLPCSCGSMRCSWPL